MSSSPIDLRSDTVTAPGADMRRAMAEAEVGDDCYGEDPTVTRLQERVAELLDKEAALFVSSGTMGNQIAIHLHTQRGNEVIAGEDAHCMGHESGAAGLISGVQIQLLGGDGRFSGEAVRAAHKADDLHAPVTRLVTVENTHNAGGGLVWERSQLDDVLATARDLALATHLDGARLWNASVASGRDVADLAAGFDTVSVCLSKGLGAPIGSVLAGRHDLIHRAMRVRKMLGGAMRQVGVIAAAGLFALEHNRERLAEDHDNAAHLARAIADIPGLRIDVEAVETNILMVDVDPRIGSAEELRLRAADRGLYFWCQNPRRFRLVTHLDVDRDACTRAAEILGAIARGS